MGRPVEKFATVGHPLWFEQLYLTLILTAS
jgi:hypothetical protein